MKGKCRYPFKGPLTFNGLLFHTLRRSFDLQRSLDLRRSTYSWLRRLKVEGPSAFPSKVALSKAPFKGCVQVTYPCISSNVNIKKHLFHTSSAGRGWLASYFCLRIAISLALVAVILQLVVFVWLLIHLLYVQQPEKDAQLSKR